MAIENLPAERSREPLPPHNTDAEEAVLGSLLIDRAAIRRRLIRAAGRIAQLGYDESIDTDQALEQAEQVLFAVGERRAARDFQRLADVLRAYWEQLLLAADVDRLQRGIPTDFKDLDKLLGGLQRSDLIIVAARPSMGKSSFALCLARNAAVRFGAKVGIFSLEMSQLQLAQRLLFSESGVDSSRLRQANLSPAERRKLAEALSVLAAAPIYLDDTPNIPLGELRAKARRLHHEVGLDLLVIDYLQLIQAGGRENRVQEISEISRSLKALARELNIPVVALSQLSRAVESRSPHIPLLSDLRESGSLEQDADVVLFIYREEVYDRDTENKGIAEIHVAKHRNGPTGQVSLLWLEKLTKFVDLSVEQP